jgi:hypothetical protein
LITTYEFIWKTDEFLQQQFSEIRLELSHKLLSSSANGNYYSLLFWLWTKLLPFTTGKQIKTQNQMRHIHFITDAFTVVLPVTDMFKICCDEYNGEVPSFLDNCEYIGSLGKYEGGPNFSEFLLYEVSLLPSLSLPTGCTKLCFFHDMVRFISFWKIWGVQRSTSLSMSTWMDLRVVLKKSLSRDVPQWFFFFFWLLLATPDDKLKYNIKVTKEVTISEPWQSIMWSIPTTQFCYLFYKIFSLSKHSFSFAESATINQIVLFLHSNRQFQSLIWNLFSVEGTRFLEGLVPCDCGNISNMEVILSVLSNFLPFTMIINHSNTLFRNNMSRSRKISLSIFLKTFSHFSNSTQGSKEVYLQLTNKFGKKNFSSLPKEILRKIIFMKTLNDAFSFFMSMYLTHLGDKVLTYQEIPEVLSILRWLLKQCDVDISERNRFFHFQHFYYRLSRVLNDNTLSITEQIDRLCEIVQ